MTDDADARDNADGFVASIRSSITRGNARTAFVKIKRAVNLDAFAAATSVSAVASALHRLLRRRDADTVAEAAVLVTAGADVVDANPERFADALTASFRDHSTSPTQRLATDYAAGLRAREHTPHTSAPSAVRTLLAAALASQRPEVRVLSREPPILVIDGVVGDAEAASAAAALEHATRHLVLRDESDHESLIFLCPPYATLGSRDDEFRAVQPEWARDVNKGQCGFADPPLAHYFGNGSHLGESVHFERGAAQAIDLLELTIGTQLFGPSDAAAAVERRSVSANLLRYHAPRRATSRSKREAELAGFGLHCDAHDFAGALSIERATSALLYLSTPTSGGETTFPFLGLSVRAKRGRLLLFDTLGKLAWRRPDMRLCSSPPRPSDAAHVHPSPPQPVRIVGRDTLVTSSPRERVLAWVHRTDARGRANPLAAHVARPVTGVDGPHKLAMQTWWTNADMDQSGRGWEPEPADGEGTTAHTTTSCAPSPTPLPHHSHIAGTAFRLPCDPCETDDVLLSPLFCVYSVCVLQERRCPSHRAASTAPSVTPCAGITSVLAKQWCEADRCPTSSHGRSQQFSPTTSPSHRLRSARRNRIRTTTSRPVSGGGAWKAPLKAPMVLRSTRRVWWRAEWRAWKASRTRRPRRVPTMLCLCYRPVA
jgi:hypothetical protein